MKAVSFEPKIIKIKKGTTVTWANSSTGMHNVVFTFAQSRMMYPRDEWKLTFDEVGTFEYFCEPHRGMGMVGTVIVE